MKRYQPPALKRANTRVAYRLGLVGLAVLIGVIAFVVFAIVHPQVNPTGTATVVPGGTAGPQATIPQGTVQPSETGPYGFTILKKFTAGTVADFKELGVTWIRYQLNWRDVEPQPGRFDWSVLDAAVALANANGLHMTFPIQNAPAWTFTHAACSKTLQVPDAQAMTQFASALAQRYNGHNQHGYIDSYEVGNEEFDDHLPRNLAIVQDCAQVNFVSLYGPVLKAGYQAIKQQSPRALVGMFGLWWPNSPHIRYYMQWLYQNGYGAYFDFANFHYYNCGDNPAVTNGEQPSFDLEWQTIHGIMAQFGDVGKPIWVTEIGWTISSVHQQQKCAISPQLQAQYMSYVLNDAANSHAIQHIFWYTIDLNNDGMSITQSGNKLPSFYVLQEFIRKTSSWS